MTKLIGFIFLTSLANSHGRLTEYIEKEPRTSWLEQDTAEYWDLPESWYWGDVNGTNFLTKNLNQHIPQYCGSCWAHGALSSLGDRVKIARNASQPDINLPVQFLLNCGKAGSCLGGSHYAAYKYIKEVGGIPFDTCLVYEACSSDSIQEVCKNRNFSCIPRNICRTCFSANGCIGVDPYPNVTISDYYALRGYKNMMIDIYNRGPIACTMNSGPIVDYKGGILDIPESSKKLDHVISVVGWGYDKSSQKKYWIVRNSWGEFWGELGFFRLVLGYNQLGIESSCAAAIPESWTNHNKPCDLDGNNCQAPTNFYD